MYDFESIKRQILDRVELLDVVGEHVRLKRVGKRWVGLCPFHSEKTPSFSVAPEQGLFKCFGCGKGGDLFTFVQHRENLPFMEVLQLLADRAGVEITSRAGGATSGRVDRAMLAKVNEWAVGFFRQKLLDGSVGEQAREYVRRRGFSDETTSDFALGLACESGPSLVAAARRAGFTEPVLVEADLLRPSEHGGGYYETFRNRLMFPIKDATNRIIGFGGRTLGDDRAKYLNTRQTALFDKGRNLYGIEKARQSITDRGRAVLVEGYTDCIACHQAGLTEAVATLGTALTAEQIGVLRRYGEELILLFDSDQAGEAAADRALKLALPACMKVKLARIPNGKDPADFLQVMGIAGFTNVLNSAVDALEFKWLQTRQRFDADASTSKRREAVLDFLQLVGEVSSSQAIDAIQRGLIVNQVAHLVRLDRDEVRQMLGKTRQVRAVIASTQPRERAVRDAEQAAWAVVLEVGLNNPALADRYADACDVSRIADARDRRIAEALFAAAAESPESRLADVLARLSDPLDAARVEELARRGADRGNFEATLDVALFRIRQAARRQEWEERRRQLLAPGGDNTSGSSRTCSVVEEQELSLTVMQYKHFAPSRLIRRATVAQIDRANKGTSS